MPEDDPAPARRACGHEHKRYHHGDLAHALLQAVRVLVERDGADRMSVSEACRMAGVSTAAPYKHFADRTDILLHLCHEGFDELEAAMLAANDPATPGGPERVAAIGRSYVRFAVANPGLFRVMFGLKRELMVKREMDLPVESMGCFQALMAEVAGASGLPISGDRAHRLAVMLWTFVHGVATLKIDGDYEIVQAPADTDEMIQLAAEGLLAGALAREASERGAVE